MIENLQFIGWELDDITEEDLILYPINVKYGKELKTTFYYQIYAQLQKLKLNDSLCKKQLIKSIWGDYDEFKDNSFRVAYNRAKRMTLKEFKSDKGIITRIA